MSRAPRKPATRKRKPQRRPPETLALEWREWLAENLLGGARPEAVLEALVEQGVPQKEARARVDETLASPIFRAALGTARRAARYGQVLRLLSQQLATRTAPAVIERAEGLTAETFFERYYATSTPVVWTDFTSGWPALERWQLAALADRFGELVVEVCEGREADPDYDINAPKLLSKTTLAELIERTQATSESNDFYMIARNRNLEGPLRPLLDDLGDLHGVLEREALVGGCQLWIGPAGTVTPLHHDTSNIIFCQIAGRKRITIAPPVMTRLLTSPRAMYADLDPELEGASLDGFRSVDLGPGESLFLPVGWWHHVRALDASVSVAFVAFTRNNDVRWYTPGKL
ncbi:MAG: cupin-like domain-containing protein [Sandaracinaceae bacterium]|nr:cupin-like domain-containing protein [Sandaracinaceae bacterium]